MHSSFGRGEKVQMTTRLQAESPSAIFSLKRNRHITNFHSVLYNSNKVCNYFAPASRLNKSHVFLYWKTFLKASTKYGLQYLIHTIEQCVSFHHALNEKRSAVHTILTASLCIYFITSLCKLIYCGTQMYGSAFHSCYGNNPDPLCHTTTEHRAYV